MYWLALVTYYSPPFAFVRVSADTFVSGCGIYLKAFESAMLRLAIMLVLRVSADSQITLMGIQPIIVLAVANKTYRDL
jgi:hypothetical protein